MPLSLAVDNPSYPKGTPLGINGLGVVENGSQVVISEETEERFFATNGISVQDAFKDQEGYTITGNADFDAPEPEPPTESPTVETVEDTKEGDV